MWLEIQGAARRDAHAIHSIAMQVRTGLELINEKLIGMIV